MGIDGRSQRAFIFAQIHEERVRQDQKWGWTDGAHSILPGHDPHAKLTVITEEVGEVARAILEGDQPNLEAELIQVAACCVAWLEARAEGRP